MRGGGACRPRPPFAVPRPPSLSPTGVISMSCASPLHTDFWGILYDWQSIIAGIFAIVAAAIGAIAAYCVGNAQIAAAGAKG